MAFLRQSIAHIRPSRNPLLNPTQFAHPSSHSIKPASSFLLLACLCSLVFNSSAYIPALPSNLSASSQSPNNGLSSSSPPINWFIQLNWQPMGTFSDGINQQLKADNSSQTLLHQGVLLHFSELNATSQPPAVVPWIALINCDSNSSVYSIQDDIFTLARDRGAAAAMLYSLSASSCRVNDEYLQNFEKPLDVFSSANLQGARLIESQFSNVLGAGYWFQSDLLNSSASTILKQIHDLGYNTTTPPSLINNSPQTSSPHLAHRSLSPASSSPSARLAIRSPRNTLKLNMNSVSRIHNSSAPGSPPIYLIATLASSDQTPSPDQQIPNGGPSSQNNASAAGNPNTGLAMIILYAITGCVTFMFLIVIVSGAVRAVRHPERYGPRARLDTDEDPFGPPRQTRAAGLGKAILDTFPVVKFGQFGRQPAPESGATKAEALALANMPETPTAAAPKGSPDHPASSLLPLMAQTPGQLPMLLSGDPVRQSLSFSSSEERTRVAGLEENRSEPGTTQVLTEQETMGGQEGHTEGEEQALAERKGILAEGLANGDKSQTEAEEGLAEAAAGAPVSTGDDAEPMSMTDATLAELNNSMTCPICVCNFEAEDEVRVLPCDARHQFHKECVDPWLLNESRFCPLCRWDLSMRKDGSRIVGQELESADVGGEGTETSSRSASVNGDGAETSRGGRESALGGHGASHVTEDEEGAEGCGSKAAQSRFVKYLELVRQKGSGRTGRMKRKKNGTAGNAHLVAVAAGGGNGIGVASGSR